MRQSKMSVFAIVVTVIALTIVLVTSAVSAQSSTTGWQPPPTKSTAHVALVHWIAHGAGMRPKPKGCVTHACKRRLWRMHHLRAPKLPQVEASWYSYEPKMGCAKRSYGWGVAHKTLPCGTLVRLCYYRRCITVPVIDRGPYVAGRVFDLEAKPKEALGFPDLGKVGWKIVGHE